MSFNPHTELSFNPISYTRVWVDEEDGTLRIQQTRSYGTVDIVCINKFQFEAIINASSEFIENMSN